MSRFRWVPRNRFYGFRIPSTLRSDSIWYDANVLCARHMIALGALMVALEFVLPSSALVVTLRAVGFLGLVTLLIADCRTANRWERERGI